MAQRGVGEGPAAVRAYASILPVACDPSGNVWFFVAHNRGARHWTEGSHVWTELGGRAQSSDADAAACAAREFCEETCGVVAWDAASLAWSPSQRLARADTLAAALRAGQYLVMVSQRGGGSGSLVTQRRRRRGSTCSSRRGSSSGSADSSESDDDMDSVTPLPCSPGASSSSSSSRSTPSTTTTWVLQVPWQPGAPSAFAHASALLRGLDCACRHGSAAVPPLWQQLLWSPECAVTRSRRAEFLLRHPAVRWHVADVDGATLHAATPSVLQPPTPRALPRRLHIIDSVRPCFLDKTHVECIHWAAAVHAVAHDGVLPFLELGGVVSCGMLSRHLLAVLLAIIPAFQARYGDALRPPIFVRGLRLPVAPPPSEGTTPGWLGRRRAARGAAHTS